MTDRARKILGGKRERVLKALEDKNRITKDGLFMLRDDEAITLLDWLKELIDDDERKE